jgi:hypothetical protein
LFSPRASLFGSSIFSLFLKKRNRFPATCLRNFLSWHRNQELVSPEAGIGGKLQKPSHISPPPDFVLLPFRPLP